MRVSQLAKELKITSKELLAQLKKLKIVAKTHASAVSDLDVAKVSKALRAHPGISESRAAGKPASKTALAKPKAVAKTTTAKVRKIPPAPALVKVEPGEKTKPAAKVKAVKPAVKMIPARPAAIAVASRPAAKRVITPVAPAPALTKGGPGKEPIKPAVKPAPIVPQHTGPSKTSKAAPAPVAEAVAPAPALAKSGPGEPVVLPPAKELSLRFPITVKQLAEAIGIKAAELIKHLMQKKIFASMTHQLTEATATEAAETFNCKILPRPSIEEQIFQDNAPDPKRMVPRAPVVTFMGHVDHGKTSLMDAIRATNVVEKEAGGITQHIGAYEVELDKGRVTFLDTPGHAAFSALRARGANVTDVVVLVVAADDGVKPQTVEAIDHAKAAGVPIVVAINKIDKPEADEKKVKQQLTQYDLLAEDWGGKTIMVSVSAKNGQGIDSLLEMLLLEAELLELKADPEVVAQGIVIEAKLTKDRGPVSTFLVQHGILHIGQTVLVGPYVGRIRAMYNDRGHRIKEAGAARPVEALGIGGVPRAGERFLVVKDEKLARQIAEQRKENLKDRSFSHPKHITLEELHDRIAKGKLKDLRLIVKADVQGSLEAVTQNLMKLDTEKTEVHFKILHAGVGDINESDIILAAASEAIVLGFHVGINPQVQVLAASEGVDLRIYNVIYELINSIKTAIEGLLEPLLEETFLGRAEARQLFQVSKVGVVAGCKVIKGEIRRDSLIRVIRGRERIFEGKIASLKRLKDDVREVREGNECGIALEGDIDIQSGDLLEAWEIKKVARKLG